MVASSAARPATSSRAASSTRRHRALRIITRNGRVWAEIGRGGGGGRVVRDVGADVRGVGQRLPLIEERGVDLPDRLPQPLDQLLELRRTVPLGDGLPEGAVGVGEVAQHQPLRAGQLVAADEVGEPHPLLPHLPHHRLRLQRLRVQPGVALAVELVRRLEQLGERPRPGDLLEQPHPLVVLDAVGLHRRDRLAAGLVLLGPEHLPRRLQHRLDHRHDVERVGLRLRVQHVERGQREVGQLLVEREVLGQVTVST